MRVGPLKGVHPRTVARATLSACARHKREVALTISGRFGIWMKKLAPGLLDYALARANTR